MAEVSIAAQYSDLYDILEACTNDELTPIVDALLKTPLSILNISRSFERHQPDHVRYKDRIGDEIYRLALLALGRGDGKRPSYGVMIIALCKKIGIPTVPNSPAANEAILLNVFVKQHLSSVPAIDRQPLVDEARAVASAAASGILSSEAWPPFASVLLQTIYLRRKLAEEGRLLSSSQIETADSVVGNPENTNVIRREQGDTAHTLAFPELDTDWHDPNRDSKVVSLFYAFLQAAQPLVAGTQILSGETLWRVSSEGGAQAHIIEKGFKGMRSLQSVSVASLLGPTAFLSLASALVEQKKLENIQKSLDEIKSSVKDVSKFQKAERRSVMTGAIRYFQQIAPSVLIGELASEVSHEIERHEVELVRVQDHLTEEIRSQIALIRATKKDAKAIQDAQTDLERMYGEILLCIRARACGYQLLCTYPGREAGMRARFEDINRGFRILSPTGELTISMDQAIREKAKGLSSYENKALLLTKEQVLFERINAEGVAILQGLKAAGQKLSDQTEPVYIDLKVKAGRVVGMRTL